MHPTARVNLVNTISQYLDLRFSRCARMGMNLTVRISKTDVIPINQCEFAHA